MFDDGHPLGVSSEPAEMRMLHTDELQATGTWVLLHG